MKDFGLKKLYYSISEVSRLTGLEQYILRYWETEFEQLRPGKNRAGNRIYTNKDIKLILQIKRLLREEKYTIEGAKKILEGFLNEGFMPVVTREQKNDRQHSIGSNPVKKDFEEIKNVLVQVYRML
ncbi:MAG: MerR family transcriptional regulator [Bacteroidota bacterium]